MWMNRTTLGMIVASLVVFACSPFPARGESDVDPILYRHVTERAIKYLVQDGQARDGSFSRQTGPAITALATTAILRHGRTSAEPAVRRSLEYLATFVNDENGGIYQEGSFYQNYETSLALICFKAANIDGQYGKIIHDAAEFLKQLQWDQGEGKARSDPAYGGAGYGKHGRPDLSNTSFMIEALQSIGDGDSEAVQKALLFVSRCQNLDSEHNLTEFASKNPDGGFYYTPAAGGQSQAGETPSGGLRSYGSMTYAGLKSMIYAGVAPDDPRVKAAIEWIRQYYSLEVNPGMSAAGLFYYYHTFAKALAALDEDQIVSADGQTHDWRDELVQELARRQLENGAWSNQTNARWMEGDANLVTSYALLALAYCRPDQ